MLYYFDVLYKKIPSSNIILRIAKYIIRVISNIYVRYFLKTGYTKNCILDKTIIVSLTSYPARINNLWMVIKTLLAQEEVDNYQIILWLSKTQFPNKLDSLPRNLRRLITKGLDIRFVDDDLKSHKKYYYAFSQYPENVIVTVDDDVLYSPSLLKTLFDAHLKFPECVICNRGNVIEMGKPYRLWNKAKCFMTPQKNILPTGIGGVLYPPHCYNQAIFNMEAIKSTCINGDDLWLNCMCRMEDTAIVHTGAILGFITVLSSQKTALCHDNVGEDNNDIQIRSISGWIKRKYNIDFYNNIYAFSYSTNTNILP